MVSMVSMSHPFSGSFAPCQSMKVEGTAPPQSSGGVVPEMAF